MKKLLYIILFLVLGVSIISIFNEMSMSYPNLEFYQDNDVIRVKSSRVKSVQKNDILLSCDSIRFFNFYNLDQHIEKSPIKSLHEFEFLSSKTGKPYSVKLKYYRLTKNSVIFSLLLIDIVFLIMAYIIIAIGPEKLYTLFLFMFFISVAVTAVTYRVCFYNKLLYSIFIFSTSFIAGFYLSFLVTFPKVRKPVSLIIVLTALTLSFLNFIFWLKAYLNFIGYKTFSSYLNLFTMAKINQGYDIFAIITGIIIISVKYYEMDNINKKRLKWFIIGQIIGFIPFIFLFSLPLLLLGHEWVNLAVVMLFFMAVPISFILGVLKIKLGSINFILARILIILLYFVIGVIFMMIGKTFGRIVNDVIIKEIIFLGLSGVYIAVVYFTYRTVMDYILRFLFKEYYRKITLVKRYIDLLKDRSKTEDLLEEVFKHLMKIFDLEYINIKDTGIKYVDEYHIELKNKKIVCFRKNKNEVINLDEIYIIKSFLCSLERNKII